MTLPAINLDIYENKILKGQLYFSFKEGQMLVLAPRTLQPR